MTKKKPTKPRRPLTRWFEVQVREVFRHSLLVQATTQAEARRLVQDGYGHHEMNPLNDAELWTRSESRIGKPPLPGSVVSAKVYDYGPETDPGRTWVLRQQVMATCSECGEEHPAYDLDGSDPRTEAFGAAMAAVKMVFEGTYANGEGT